MNEPELTREERDEENLAWAFSTSAERCAFISECFARETPPYAGTSARELFDNIDARARATIAYRLLSAALEIHENAQERGHEVLREAERVRAEFARARVAWRQAEALAKGILT
jgi:hypothetical protein